MTRSNPTLRMIILSFICIDVSRSELHSEAQQTTPIVVETKQLEQYGVYGRFCVGMRLIYAKNNIMAQFQ